MKAPIIIANHSIRMEKQFRITLNARERFRLLSVHFRERSIFWENYLSNEGLLLNILIWMRPSSIYLTALNTGLLYFKSSCLEAIIILLAYKNTPIETPKFTTPGPRYHPSIAPIPDSIIKIAIGPQIESIRGRARSLSAVLKSLENFAVSWPVGVVSKQEQGEWVRLASMELWRVLLEFRTTQQRRKYLRILEMK